MKQLVLGSLVTGVVLFLWGFVFWGLIPVPGMHEPTDEAALWESLGETIPESGAYYVPNFEGGPEAVERHEMGPTAMLFVRVEGSPTMPPSMMVIGFFHMAATAFLIGLLMMRLSAHLRTYRDRVVFVALVGIVVAFWADLAWPVWWRTPWSFFLGMAVYDVVAWLLAGVVLARFVRPEHHSAAAAPSPA